ncbi:MAG TPA: chitin deacetylase, partial [Planctomycetes bacterium]|nr:chitin deacetylase [Planctomycetota bacterium]
MKTPFMDRIPRRQFLAGSLATTLAASTATTAVPAPAARPKAQIAITLDLEMSRHYPRRGITEWDYQKGNLDAATKKYALEAGQLVKRQGGLLHYFCVGRVLEQPDISWLQQLSQLGHPIGNHTYDHVNLKATTPAMAQYRFKRSPWLVKGMTVPEILRENIRLTTIALKERAKIDVNGFRTPGGFRDALDGRADLQQLLLQQKFSWVSS